MGIVTQTGQSGPQPRVTAALISEHRRIIVCRNILIHGYAQIDDRLVWGVLDSKPPTFSQEVAQLLEEETP